MAAPVRVRPQPQPLRRPRPQERRARPARPELRVVRRRRLRPGPTVALGMLLAFAIAFGLVTFQTVLVQGQQRLDRLDARTAEASEEYVRLREEVARLESPARIVDAAADLGMVPPPEVTYLTPSSSG